MWNKIEKRIGYDEFQHLGQIIDPYNYCQQLIRTNYEIGLKPGEKVV